MCQLNKMEVAVTLKEEYTEFLIEGINLNKGSQIAV